MSLFLVVSLSLYFLLQTRFFVISLSLSLSLPSFSPLFRNGIYISSIRIPFLSFNFAFYSPCPFLFLFSLSISLFFFPYCSFSSFSWPELAYSVSHLFTFSLNYFLSQVCLCHWFVVRLPLHFESFLTLCTTLPLRCLYVHLTFDFGNVYLFLGITFVCLFLSISSFS